MDRRKSLKSIILGGVATGLAAHGCKPEVATTANETSQLPKYTYGRTPKEKEHDEELFAETFFNGHEMETIAVLCNLILPADSDQGLGGALDAEVPDFIEFMAKDIPEMQITLRGGLMWLDHRCQVDNNTTFILASTQQQEAILDMIAYPDVTLPQDEHPLEIQFFSLMRNLTLTGYYTSKMGIEELGYQGNMPNVWDGVPDDVLAQHGISYDQDWLAKCVDQSKRGTIAKWDENGNLLT
ncbi:gluconate 2-dehydrogenase subunit 3 family protein [Flagellimonas sp.]|uniref:gluconate 2-dehydrogenase subunit 3 family protein n=1 Tax=Flagellimonas sp. TaxID=2058762 RepID=UPI003BB00174